MPYCLFRFAVSFRTPSRVVRFLALAVTAGIVAFTFALHDLPAPGFPPPPNFLAYRVSFGVAFGFLFGYVVISLFMAGRGEPPIAATRMRLLAIGVVGSRGPGGGGRSGSPWPDGRSRHPGPDRGDGGLVPHGTGPSLVPTGLLEPQGGRGLPPGRRRTRLCRGLGGRGRAPAAPRVRAGGRVGGRPPGQRRHRRGPLPGVARGRRVRPLDESPGSEGAKHRRITVRTHSGATHSLAVKHQPVHAVLRQRRSCTSSTSLRAWSGSPSSGARWPSRWRSRPRTTA